MSVRSQPTTDVPPCCCIHDVQLYAYFDTYAYGRLAEATNDGKSTTNESESTVSKQSLLLSAALKCTVAYRCVAVDSVDALQCRLEEYVLPHCK